MDKQLKDLLYKLKELTATVSILENNERFITFTQKEIMQMPKTFRKVFRLQGCTAHVRKRQDDRYNCSYEIRYTRDGYNISASGTTLAIAKQRFIEKINNAPNPKNATFDKIKKRQKQPFLSHFYRFFVIFSIFIRFESRWGHQKTHNIL